MARPSAFSLEDKFGLVLAVISGDVDGGGGPMREGVGAVDLELEAPAIRQISPGTSRSASPPRPAPAGGGGHARVRNPVSRRDTVELGRDLFGCELSTGAVDAIVQRASEALAEPHAQLQAHVRSAPVVMVHETGWRLRGSKRTLWAALTSTEAVFPDRP